MLQQMISHVKLFPFCYIAMIRSVYEWEETKRFIGMGFVSFCLNI